MASVNRAETFKAMNYTQQLLQLGLKARAEIESLVKEGETINFAGEDEFEDVMYEMPEVVHMDKYGFYEVYHVKAVSKEDGVIWIDSVNSENMRNMMLTLDEILAADTIYLADYVIDEINNPKK